MWFQAALCLIVVGAYAHPSATSHQSREDHIEHMPHHDAGHHDHDAGHHEKHHPHHVPSYKYSYSVHDPKTGDQKGAHESRIGDEVKGAYGLVEPDGNVRSVHYTANHKDGFHAVVHHKTVHHHHVPQHEPHHHEHHHLPHHEHHISHDGHHGHHISHHGHHGHHMLGHH